MHGCVGINFGSYHHVEARVMVGLGKIQYHHVESSRVIVEWGRSRCLKNQIKPWCREVYFFLRTLQFADKV